MISYEKASKLVKELAESDKAKEMNGLQAARQLGISISTVRRHVLDLYGLPISGVFPKGKYRFDIENIPFSILTNQEIAEEYGMSADHAGRLRRRLGIPLEPDHVREARGHKKFASLLNAVDFYDWLKTNGKTTTFKGCDIDEYRRVVHGYSPRRAVPRGWWKAGWVERNVRRKPGVEASQYKFTPEFHALRKKVGLLSEHEYSKLLD